MSHYVGLDLSVENTAICVIDGAGKIVAELSAPSHPEDLVAELVPFAGEIEAIGLEAGPNHLTTDTQVIWNIATTKRDLKSTI